ncbi:hypothetical protein ERIN107935_03905 [Erysipelothrix inopinata]
MLLKFKIRHMLIIQRRMIWIIFSSLAVYLSLNYSPQEFFLIEYGFMYQNISTIWISFFDISTKAVIVLSSINNLKQLENLIRIRIGCKMKLLYFINVFFILVLTLSQSLFLMIIKVKSIDNILLFYDFIAILVISLVASFFYNIKNPRLSYFLLVLLLIVQRLIFTFYYAC